MSALILVPCVLSLLCAFVVSGALKRKLSKKSAADEQPELEQQQEDDEAAKSVKRATTPDPKETVGAAPPTPPPTNTHPNPPYPTALVLVGLGHPNTVHWLFACCEFRLPVPWHLSQPAKKSSGALACQPACKEPSMLGIGPQH